MTPVAAGLFRVTIFQIFNKMKTIPLTQGKAAIVDDEDYESLMRWKWYAHKQRTTYRAERKEAPNGKQKSVKMHRVIMQDPEGMFVDHKNGDSLDNRKSNLRVCTIAQNNRNRAAGKNSRSGYCGVHFFQKRYMAKIGANGKRHYLGYFDTPKEAAIAYNEAAIRLHGEFARLNKITEETT